MEELFKVQDSSLEKKGEIKSTKDKITSKCQGIKANLKQKYFLYEIRRNCQDKDSFL